MILFDLCFKTIQFHLFSALNISSSLTQWKSEILQQKLSEIFYQSKIYKNLL